MKYIIISTTTAKNIVGKYGKYSQIDPIPLGDGKYIVPESVLTDPDLAEVQNKIPISNQRKTIDDIRSIYPNFQKSEDGI